MSKDTSTTDYDLERVNKRLSRMGTAIGSNNLSDMQVQSEEGKALMQHMLSSVMADDFDADQTREMIKARLASAGQR